MLKSSDYKILSKPQLIGIIFEPNNVDFDGEEIIIGGNFKSDWKKIDEDIYISFLDYILPNVEDSKIPFSCRMSMSMVLQIHNTGIKNELLSIKAPNDIYDTMKKIFEYITKNSVYESIEFPKLNLAQANKK